MILLGMGQSNAYSQLSQSNTKAQTDILLVNDLMENNRYIAAQELISSMDKSKLTEQQIQELDYYNALTSLKLDLHESAGLVEEFESRHPDYSRLETLKKAKGDYYFKHKKYKQAVREYVHVNSKNLVNDDKLSYFFKIGYSYFMTKNSTKASSYLYKVKDSKSSYAPSATYYYAHINYENKNYPSALKGFIKLEDDRAFKSIVPYYICQIYYKQEEYDKLIETAPKLFDEARGTRKNEIAKLVGDAYFKLERYPKAIEYLDFYRESSRSGYLKSDYYQLAYAYMMVEDYPNAIKYFEKVRNREDALSQNALYNLGNCYLKTNQKEFAAKAFYASYQLGFDLAIKEDAMFNFAKISYELSNDPFNRAITAINEYIDSYPDSPRRNEAYSYLVNLFLSSKNYKGALVSIERIPDKSPDLNKAYQRIAFNRASELYSEYKYEEATQLFIKSLENPYDKTLALKAKFWQADCQYQLKKYYISIKLWKELATDYRIQQIEEESQIDYNIAYSYYMLENYNEAILWYKKVVDKPRMEAKLIADAYLRTGDCYYILKNFQEAVDYYSYAYDMGKQGADYAMYQRALANGGLGKIDQKLQELQLFINKYPKSKLADDALFELGTTYLITDKNQMAVNSFSALVKNYPNSPFKRKALLKIGLTYYNMDQNEDALQVLKSVVASYSGTKESKEALVSIRNIYVESNAAEDFFVYVKNIPFASISNNEQDSISYMATENVYMNGDCDGAIPGFNNYLSQYPEGSFTINAHFYRAECLMKANEFAIALSDYEFVLENSPAAFRETALLKTARIYRFDKEYMRALRNYQELFNMASNEMYLSESLDGQLECYQAMEMSDSVLVMAKTILTSTLVSEQTIKKAHAYRAHAALVNGDLNLANQEYTVVSKLMQGSTAAEAKYYQALIQYKLGNYKESEKYIFELLNEYGSYDKWVSKGFILSADIYAKYGNTSQAKQTLQSIIDYQEDTVLVNIAIKKKKIIEELEAIEEMKNEAPQEADSVMLDEELR
jgi:TolA-binding protein